MSAADLEQQIKATIDTRAMDLRHALYLDSGNRVHAWRAYTTARQLDLAIPAWVLEYFDTCAKALTTKHASAKAIATALGLATRGGPVVTRQADTDERNLEMVIRIEQLRQRPTRRELKALADNTVSSATSSIQGIALNSRSSIKWPESMAWTLTRCKRSTAR